MNAKSDEVMAIVSSPGGLRKVARLLGDHLFNTGKACKHGHFADRYVATGQCRECVLDWHKTRYANSREEILQQHFVRRTANLPKFLAKEAMARKNGAARIADGRRRRRGQTEAPTREKPEFCEMNGCAPGEKGLAEDHDHSTGKFRGWLCGKCNSALGLLGDDKKSLLAGLNYLERAALPTLAKIEALQNEISKLPQSQELVTSHYWADGMYMRTLFRPKGTLIAGKKHKQEHFYMIVSGDVTVTWEGFRERVTGPKVFVCQPGTKRAVFAHEDSLCMTVHRTDEKDLEKIEAELVEEDLTGTYLPGNILKERLLP